MSCTKVEAIPETTRILLALFFMGKKIGHIEMARFCLGGWGECGKERKKTVVSCSDDFVRKPEANTFHRMGFKSLSPSRSQNVCSIHLRALQKKKIEQNEAKVFSYWAETLCQFLG